MLMQKAAEFKIDVNTKDNLGKIAFHLACTKIHTDIAKILMQNSSEFNIDLNAKDIIGETAFSCACRDNNANNVEMMIANTFNFDFSVTNSWSKTGYQRAK